MPEIKVTDHFTANAEYIEKYVGVTGTESGAGTNQDSSVAPYEVGSQAGKGKLYLGNTITEAAPIPEQAGASVTSPGVLVWNVGNMNAQESRSLVYRVQLKPEYTGAQSRGVITNAAASFAKEGIRIRRYRQTLNRTPMWEFRRPAANIRRMSPEAGPLLTR